MAKSKKLASKKPATAVSKKRVVAKPAAALPPPEALERICKGLAALDAMMAEDWEDRYYSFNAAWNPKGKERMAQMRNGSGDDWFIVFAPTGVFVKSFWHEFHPRVPGAILYEGVPQALAPLVSEPSF